MSLLSVQVEDNKKLGEMVGLCKIDKDGNPRKVVGCSCVVVKVRERPTDTYSLTSLSVPSPLHSPFSCPLFLQ